MISLSQEQLMIVIRALSLYMIDQVQNGDLDNSEKTAKLIHEAAHNIKG